MTNIFLTSDIGAQKKVNGQKIVCATDNTYGLVDQIKSVIKPGNFVFVASSPDSHERNEVYAENVFKSLSMAGIDFENKVVVDDRNASEFAEILKGACFVFVSGGYPPSQIEFIKKYGIDKELQKFDGVVVGQSAGAMNLAEVVYNYPDDLSQINDEKFWNGVGLSNITIIPHFDLKNGNPGVEDVDLINDYFLPDSKVCDLYAVPNGSHIWIKNNIPAFFGKNYLIKNGEIYPIRCDKTIEK